MIHTASAASLQAAGPPSPSRLSRYTAFQLFAQAWHATGVTPPDMEELSSMSLNTPHGADHHQGATISIMGTLLDLPDELLGPPRALPSVQD